MAIGAVPGGPSRGSQQKPSAGTPTTAQLVAVQLARLDRAGDRQRPARRAQLQSGTAGEAARIEQQISGLLVLGTRLQAIRQGRGDPPLQRLEPSRIDQFVGTFQVQFQGRRSSSTRSESRTPASERLRAA